MGVEQFFFPGTDDGSVGPINIPGGFPFGNSVQDEVYVSMVSMNRLIKLYKWLFVNV